MNIDETKLRDLLNQRKRYIKTHGDIITAAISLSAYIVTIILSDVSKLKTWSIIVVAAMALVYVVILVYAFLNSRYSVDALYRDIVSCSSEHNFSLILLKDSRGRFLLKKDRRWKTYLFPYSKTKENDIESIINFAKESLGIETDVIKQKESDFTKQSVSANMTKTYHHIFYQLSFNPATLPDKDKFTINGSTYRWFSFDEMKENKNIWLKNYENFDFVEKNF